MKKTALILFLTAFCSLRSFSQTVPAAEATKHIGEKVTVCGKVFGGRFFESSDKTLLNVGGLYPNNTLTIVIEGENRKKFSFKPEEFYTNKEVCITGEVKEYKGKPEMHVTEVAQITLSEAK